MWLVKKINLKGKLRIKENKQVNHNNIKQLDVLILPQFAKLGEINFYDGKVGENLKFYM